MSAGLDLHLSGEQRELYASTARLAAVVLAPIAEAGAPYMVNRPLVEALASHGLLARLFSDDAALPDEREVVPRIGGQPPSHRASAIDLCLIREALATACTEAETLFALQGLGSYPILQSGSEAVRAQWIPRVASGEAIAAFALSEPDAGSDAAALSLVAELDGDGYRLTGEKKWISNAPEADIYTVFARTGGPGPKGVSAFAVPGDSEGLSGERLRLLAPHAIGTLTFDGVYVEGGQMLGAPGEGFRVAMRTLDLFRPSVGAFAIGMARSAISLAVAHARARAMFGGHLSDRQAVTHRLADVSARVEAARLMVHQAAAAHDAGEGDRSLAAMAKLLATETAQEAVDLAIQIHGAAGLEQGHPLEHLYREVRAPRIYEGASGVQREIIARGMFA
jgi:alkylation response protein AidB-like acyl-CoA dehydrogenase